MMEKTILEFDFEMIIELIFNQIFLIVRFFLRRTVRVFDDPSAWYHIVVKLKLDEGN